MRQASERETDHSKGAFVDLDTEGSRSVVVMVGLVGRGVSGRRSAVRRGGAVRWRRGSIRCRRGSIGCRRGAVRCRGIGRRTNSRGGAAVSDERLDFLSHCVLFVLCVLFVVGVVFLMLYFCFFSSAFYRVWPTLNILLRLAMGNFLGQWARG